MAYESDWIFLREAIQDLRDYILSSDVYWTLRPRSRDARGMQLPQLTIGSLRLSQARLAALALPPDQQAELANLARQIDAVQEEWRANWGLKANREFTARLNLWQQYVSELRSDIRHSASIYSNEVRKRAILRLLSSEVTADLPAHLTEQLGMLDQILRGLSRPGPFVWEPELSAAFPQAVFWFLYVSFPEQVGA